jgi:hypothetical protein
MSKKVNEKGLVSGKIGPLYPLTLEHVDDMQTVLEWAIIKVGQMVLSDPQVSEWLKASGLVHEAFDARIKGFE